MTITATILGATAGVILMKIFSQEYTHFDLPLGLFAGALAGYLSQEKIYNFCDDYGYAFVSVATITIASTAGYGANRLGYLMDRYFYLKHKLAR
jgi:hypothetical protein